MISDDTEHTLMTAQALLAYPNDEREFARALAGKLRWWLIGLPAGVGLATARAITRLWFGRAPDCSGVFSAGNGPAMRAAILGVMLGDDAIRLTAYVRASTRITHTDPRAEAGALAVAFAAWFASKRNAVDVAPGVFLARLRELLPDQDSALRCSLDVIETHLAAGSSPQRFAESLGLKIGISGFVDHTVPAVLFCWLRSAGDYRQALTDVVNLGGDTDSTGAILGGIAGATVGATGIPCHWIDGICEWPRSVGWMKTLARRLTNLHDSGTSQPQVRLFWPAIVVRNFLFLVIVLGHGFRRLAPPY